VELPPLEPLQAAVWADGDLSIGGIRVTGDDSALLDEGQAHQLRDFLNRVLPQRAVEAALPAALQLKCNLTTPVHSAAMLASRSTKPTRPSP
jgi:hypothetical protein